jgi:hypothetical protein
MDAHGTAFIRGSKRPFPDRRTYWQLRHERRLRNRDSQRGYDRSIDLNHMETGGLDFWNRLLHCKAAGAAIQLSADTPLCVHLAGEVDHAGAGPGPTEHHHIVALFAHPVNDASPAELQPGTNPGRPTFCFGQIVKGVDVQGTVQNRPGIRVQADVKLGAGEVLPD